MSAPAAPSFFKVFLPQRSAHRMRVPSAFRKHMRGKKSGLVYLTGTSGDLWPVELVQQRGKLYFAQGWSKFVKDHSIREAHFLVFEFDGSDTFKVQIYSPNGCKEEAAVGASPSPYPCFMLQLRSYGVRDQRFQRMHIEIPRSFFRLHITHIVNKSTPIRLQWEDKEWAARLTCSADRCYIYKGWRQFIRESKVQEGDSCQFELQGQRILRIRVCYRVCEE